MVILSNKRYEENTKGSVPWSESWAEKRRDEVKTFVLGCLRKRYLNWDRKDDKKPAMDRHGESGLRQNKQKCKGPEMGTSVACSTYKKSQGAEGCQAQGLTLLRLHCFRRSPTPCKPQAHGPIHHSHGMHVFVTIVMFFQTF